MAKKTKPFFESQKHPGLVMNRFGVVMALRSNPMADSELWCGVDWEHVPLKTGRESYDLAMAVQEECWESGYTYRHVKGERVYSKPAKVTA